MVIHFLSENLSKHLTETIANAGIDKYNCIFIGDSIADAECAKNSKSQLILLEHC